MTEIDYIPFHGHQLPSVLLDNQPYVVFRPVVEVLGLDYSTQLAKLRSRSWANRRDIPTVGADGKSRLMACIDTRTLTMWLATINETKVAEAARDDLVRYQSQSADAVHDYWTTKGSAVARPAPEPAARRDVVCVEPDLYSYDEVCAILRQRFGLRLVVNELTRSLRHAGLLKINGTPRAKWEHLFWFVEGTWFVVAHTLPQLAYKVVETGREMGDWRFIQLRLELEGVGTPDTLDPTALQARERK